jgi:hypothetical protein
MFPRASFGLEWSASSGGPSGNETAADEAGGGRHDSIGRVRARLAFLAGGAAVAGAAVYRFFRRAPAPPSGPDTHAEELRAKLAESRAVVADREEFDSAETPVDEADEVVAPDLGDRRRAVHARGRHVAEEMRRGSDG